jgi:hypothetical protein
MANYWQCLRHKQLLIQSFKLSDGDMLILSKKGSSLHPNRYYFY